ncbi:MAG: HNH endonuclease [Candidatus Dojkabacteria bacterium]|nr:HNH endonuclease [Candidatus Dojkabacteria bacterium]
MMKEKYPRCLVLSVNNQILSITPWIRAINLSEKRKNDVIVLSWYDDYKIHSESKTFKIPAVIKLNYYVKLQRKKMEQNFNAPTLKNILVRDNFTCQYCGKKISFRNATRDHVIPLSHGGKNSIDNVVSSCHECNFLKGNLSLEEFERKYHRHLINKPRPLTDEEKIKILIKFFKNKEKKIWLKSLKKEGIDLW